MEIALEKKIHIGSGTSDAKSTFEKSLGRFSRLSCLGASATAYVLSPSKFSFKINLKKYNLLTERHYQTSFAVSFLSVFHCKPLENNVIHRAKAITQGFRALE